MSTVNRVILIGRVGKDPEVQARGEGKIASFSLATDRKTDDGKTTDWHRVVVYNDGIAKVVADYVKKGSKICVIGELGTRSYTNKTGQEQRVTEILLGKFGAQLTLLDKREGGGRPTSEAGYGSKSQEQPKDFEDEIPF